MPGVFGTTQIARTGAPPKPPPRPAPLTLPQLNQNVGQWFAQHQAAPTPRPPPPASVRTGYNPRGVAIPAAPPKPTINDVRAASLAASYARGDSPGPQGNYGQAAVDAFKQTPAYKAAIIDVFNHQSPNQQQAIVQGTRTNPASPEAGRWR
jgi:hypothetical protein